jgi:hypothetical protein
MRSLFIPVRLVADARGLEFESNLDKNIDQVNLQLSLHGYTPDINPLS